MVLCLEAVLPAGQSAADTIAAAHAQGGFYIAAYPYDWAVPSLGTAGLHRRCRGVGTGGGQLDAIKGLTANTNWPSRITNHLAQCVARRLNFPAVAGSDANTLATAGRAYTVFLGDTTTDLRDAIPLGS